jgi:hypothetical protein
LHAAQRIFAATSRPESIAVLRKLVLEDRFDHLPKGRLHNPTTHRWNAQRTALVRTGLRNPDPFHRQGLTARLSELLL